ncbi:hypothetical protein [Microbulbifer halophilus]|uniref:hypothetical protein n=1 Tax=Microbulbifer halophilus TaxID=453963 RepID=UPI003619A16C
MGRTRGRAERWRGRQQVAQIPQENGAQGPDEIEQQQEVPVNQDVRSREPGQAEAGEQVQRGAVFQQRDQFSGIVHEAEMNQQACDTGNQRRKREHSTGPRFKQGSCRGASVR